MGTDVYQGSLDDFIALIEGWYGDDHDGFKTGFDAAVAGVQPIPEGQDPSVVHDWKGAGIDDLCRFFREWYGWMPDVPTGLEYIQKFSWLYYENEAGLAFVTQGIGFEMTKDFVDLRGRHMDSKVSLPLVQTWIDHLGPEIVSHFKRTKSEEFKSFNDFFSRDVIEGARPIADPTDQSIVVAPADCVINMIVDDLAIGQKLPVKTVCLDIDELLDHSKYAKEFIGGTAVSCILMPNMYHRYHTPVAGTVVESNSDVAGEYFGIKDFPDLLHKGDVGYGYDYSVFEHFRRGYLVIKTPERQVYDYESKPCHTRTVPSGLVAMIPVGLNTVASVVFKDSLKRITSEADGVKVDKGEEVGYFAYGGSLNILLFEKGQFPSLTMLQGQRIGQLTG